MSIQDLLSHPVSISIISAGGASLINYSMNRSKIKADTESIVASTYNKLLKDLDDQLDRLRVRVEELEEKLKTSQESLEDALKEKGDLLLEVKKIRRRNEDLLKENNILIKKNDQMLESNADLMRENNKLQTKIIELEIQIKALITK
jgi:chromosome segregation ATPase